ncbi:MAG: glutamate 5-kinase [Muribaculaceae bacterium]|nr:glutamate 5-kinase [Muribaculaceae bacterium]MDE6541617.1 glutamate 5-kinase [Muribaculaceae bacterium]
MTDCKRVTIKIGSNVLTRRDGMLDFTRMSAIVDQIAGLREAGIEVVLVSSGAVASGRGELRDIVDASGLDDVSARQLFSAVGQAKLINRYFELFRDHRLVCGQVLATKENLSTRRHYLNQQRCVEVMLRNGVVPVVNENDTVSVTELMFTDNDELSGLMATMTDSDALIILSNIDGIYTGDPSDPASELISVVEQDADVSACISTSRSSLGRGGMTTKYRIARKVAAEGVAVVIANGKRDGVLTSLLLPSDAEAVPHTLFRPAQTRPSSLRKWIAHSDSFAKGAVRVNHGAAEALRAGGASLLAVGATDIDGDFERDDIVRVLAPDGSTVAWGRCAYDAAEARAALGVSGQRPLIHADYLYVDETDLFRDK